MATRLPSKLPGGKRRFEVRKRTKSAGASSPVEASPVLKKQTRLVNRSTAEPSPEPDEPDESVDSSPDIDASEEETPESSANFAEKDIQPDFISSEKADPEKTDDKNEVAKKEAGSDESDGNKSALSDKEKALKDEDGEGEGLYNPNVKRRRTLKVMFRSRKSKAAAVIVTGGVVAAIFMAISTPVFLLQHISHLIMENHSADLTTQHMAAYRRSKFASVSDLFSKDGRRGGAIIAQMQKKGYIFSFDRVEKNKIVGIRRLASSTTTVNINGAAEKVISDFIDQEHPILSRSAKWKSKYMEAFYSRYQISRASVITPTAEDLEDPGRTMNKNLARAIQGDAEKTDVELDRVNLDEDATDEEKAANESREALARGDSTMFDADNKALLEGAYVHELSEAAQVAPEIKTGTGINLIRVLKNMIDNSSIASKTMGVASNLFDVTDIPDTMCVIQRRLRLATQLARAARATFLMRYAFAFVSADDGQRKGEAASKLAGALLSRVSTTDALGGTFGSSTGYSYMANGHFNKANNELFRSPVAVDGKLSGVYKTFKDKTDIPGCSVWTNPVAKIGINVGIAVASIFTGGAAKGATTFSLQAARVAITDAMKQILTKQGLRQLGFQAAIGAIGSLSLEGIALMVQLYAEQSLNFDFTGQEQGAMLSMILAGGGGAINKQRALQAGMVPATAEQYAQAHGAYLAEKEEAFKDRSFFARILDMDNKESLAYNSVANLALHTGNATTSVNSAASTLANAPSAIFGSLSSFTSLFIPKTSAQSADDVAFDTYETEGENSGIDLATDVAGNLLPVMRTDIAAIDPQENIEYLIQRGDIDELSLLPKSNRFKQHVLNCVEAPDTLSFIEENKNPSEPEFDCLATLQLTVRFKAHLAYLDMLDGIDAALFPEEISEGGNLTTGTNTNTLGIDGLNGYVIPCGGDPRQVIRKSFDSADWSGIPDSGTIGLNSVGKPIRVYIREACAGQSSIRTVVIVGSIHGSENGGQLVAHELLFNEQLPADVRIVAIPEYCSCAGTGVRGNANGVDLNRNNAYKWGSLPQTQAFSGGTYSKGSEPASEPETKALNAFLLALGKTSLSFFYHDNLNYVGASNNTLASLAVAYGNAADMPIGNGNINIYQRGSADAWYNQETDTPTLLVELSNNQSSSAIKKQVDAVKSLLVGNGTIQ